MAVTEGFKDLVRDLLADFGPVTIRNMFGGAGIYAGGVMFAILDDDVLYLKTDEDVRARLPGRRDGTLHLCNGGQGPGRHVLFRGAAAAPRGARGTRCLDA